MLFGDFTLTTTMVTTATTLRMGTRSAIIFVTLTSLLILSATISNEASDENEDEEDV